MVSKLQVFNLDGALRGMRNPLQSYAHSDNWGQKDVDLAKKLVKAGPEHRKFLRQIFVSMDITTNHTVWAQLDTYKIGVTRNSCSKMHTIHKRDLTLDDFSHESLDDIPLGLEQLQNTITILNALRAKYIETKDMSYWRALIDLLPMSYNIRATVTMNYENVLNIIRQRKHHKMEEWQEFCSVLMKLPLMDEFIL